MSVLINMEMPTSCYDCNFTYQDQDSEHNIYWTCAAVHKSACMYKRRDDCPLILVPEYGQLIEKLAAYEDAEEQGLFVKLPCKVGDTVWSKDVEPWTVVSVEWFSRKVIQLHSKSPVTGRGMTFSVGKRSLGKTVFLTREEAEAALKEKTEQDDYSKI